MFKVTHLFRSRNFNIDSISVGVTEDKKYSRMTITTIGDEKQITQIVKQLDKMIDTIEVRRLDVNNSVYRELVMFKIKVSKPEDSMEINKLASAYSAKTHDAKNGGTIFGICGGLQMLGKSLEDHYKKEGINEISSFSNIGMNLLPIKTTFGETKQTSQREEKVSWPSSQIVKGFEMHYGESNLINNKNPDIISLFKNSPLGWVIEKKDKSFIGGTFL